jgi:Zn-dependent peptidase ImmA (M78 family)
MMNFSFNSKANGVPILSKEDIEYIAGMILGDYMPSLLSNPAALDVEHLSECYAGLEVDYKDLTHNKSILGMIVFNDGYVPVYDAENNKAEKLAVEEGTILIDSSLLEDDQRRRGRFTHCHEVAHWFLHRNKYLVDKNQLNFFDLMPEERITAIKCRTTDIESTGRKQLVTDDDWMEWQADYLASTLLMPQEPFIKVFQNYIELLGLEDRYEEMIAFINTDIYADGVMKYVAEIFDVSLIAAKIRLKNLGLIRDNRQNSII